MVATTGEHNVRCILGLTAGGGRRSNAGDNGWATDCMGAVLGHSQGRMAGAMDGLLCALGCHWTLPWQDGMLEIETCGQLNAVAGSWSFKGSNAWNNGWAIGCIGVVIAHCSGRLECWKELDGRLTAWGLSLDIPVEWWMNGNWN